MRMRDTLITLAVVLPGAAAAAAQSSIDAVNKYAWGENIGFMNWRDANGAQDGVRIESQQFSTRFLTGYIWSESVGWIHVGSGVGNYANTDDTNYGVNVLGSGRLDGFGWSETCGWINFGTKSALGADGARLEGGRFRGYAWGENIGWINLDDDQTFVAITSCPEDLSGDGVVDASDLAELLGSWGPPGGGGPADFNDNGEVDAGDLALILGSWGVCGS